MPAPSAQASLYFVSYLNLLLQPNRTMNLQEELRQTIEEYESIKLARSYYENLVDRIDLIRKDLLQLEDIIDRHSGDIAKLEGFSLKGLFYELLGDKESQLEKAKQAYLQNILRYRELKRRMELSNYEKSILEKKVARFDEVSLKLNALVKTRENLLDQTEPRLRREIQSLNAKIERQIRRKAELKAANNLAYKIIEYLGKMIDLLNQTWAWGSISWNPFSKISNQSNIDRAQELLYKSKQLLIRLEDELVQIEKHAQKEDPSFELTLARRFSEIYIENLILDWILRGRIRNAKTSISNTRDKIKLLQFALKKESRDIDSYIQQLERQKKQLILNKKSG
jgi:hypothetical protein